MSKITWTRRTLIVPGAIVEQARQLCAAAVSVGGSGMFVVPLSADGSEPATHYISSGLIDEDFAALLASPQAMHDGLAQIGIDVPLQQCEGILSAADVSTESGHDAMARLGLMFVEVSE